MEKITPKKITDKKRQEIGHFDLSIKLNIQLPDLAGSAKSK
ncbi:MAG: hypothetical protein AB7P14_06760 [Blastocatellales bacterium]